MTLPGFLNPSVCDYQYTLMAGVTDVNQILAQLTTQLTVTPPVAARWTEAPAGTFTSPSDSAGRYIVCAFSRVAASLLRMILTDHHGITICNRICQINVVGTDTEVYTGSFYIVIEPHLAGPSILLAYLVDMTPEKAVGNPYPAIGAGYLSSGGAVDGFGAYGYFYAVDTMAAAVLQRLVATTFTFGGAAYPLLMPSGRYIFERGYVYQLFRTTSIITGGLWQSLVGYEGVVAFNDVTVPLGNGSTGVFRATNWGTVNRGRLYVRKA